MLRSDGASRNIYLETVPARQALQVLLDAWRGQGGGPVPGEEIPVEEALGRITAGPVYAGSSSPGYDSAAMDGIAVRSADTFGASDVSPRRLEGGKDFLWVDTGDPLPAGYDAVIRVEDVNLEDKIAEIVKAARPRQHVRTAGEDVVEGEPLFPVNHRLEPRDLGALVAGGVYTLSVRRAPRVSVIPTGDELVTVAELRERKAHPAPGQIPEFNSLVLASLARQQGAAVTRWEPVADNPESLAAALDQALGEADLVVFNAGSSAGRDDLLSGVLAGRGQVLVHGVAIRPGHPVILALVDGVPVLGLPGFPVAAYINFRLFALPVLAALLGLPVTTQPGPEAGLARGAVSSAGIEEYVRVQLAMVGGRPMAFPAGRGAGSIVGLSKSAGLARIPADTEEIPAGHPVEVAFLRPDYRPEHVILLAGSHDLSLGVMDNLLSAGGSPYRLATASTGSLAGLRALARGEVHAAAVHLLDADTGEYNVAHVARLIAGPSVLVRVAGRDQGLMVAPGNPLEIGGLADLPGGRVRFLNRQAGSGTRILLDYLLGQMGLTVGKIRGYGWEEYTHLAVARAVADGAADAALGTRAAANLFHLEFIPVGREQFDLVLRPGVLHAPAGQALLAVLGREEFAAALNSLGGYDLKDTGQVIEIG